MNKLSKMSDSELGTLYIRVEKTIAAGHYFFEELCDKLRKEINTRNWSSWELRGYETKSGNPYQIDLVCYNCII